MGVVQVGVRRLPKKGLVAEADDDHQDGVEEDVGARRPREASRGVEGEGGDEQEEATQPTLK
jgi:hypothetical protein